MVFEQYHFGVFSWIYLITGVFALTFAIFLSGHKIGREVRCLSRLFVAIAIWGLANFFEAGGKTEALKIFWSQVSYFGIPWVGYIFLTFALNFSNLSQYMKARYLIPLAIIPFMALVFALTNAHHKWIWIGVAINPDNFLGTYDHGPFFWVFIGYTYLLIMAAIILILYTLLRQHRYYTLQMGLLLTGALFPIIGNLFYLTSINPVVGLDWTPISFWISALLLYLGIRRNRLFDLIPIARDQLIQKMNLGYLVVGTDFIIRDYNQAVGQYFGIHDFSKLIGSRLSDYVKDAENLCHKISSMPDQSMEMHDEMQIGKKWIEVWIKPLTNNRNRVTGRLAIFNDITIRKEAELREQEYLKTLAKEIKEKEQLIAELDSYAHTVAHDLKTPLGGLINLLELIQDELSDYANPSIKTYIAFVRESAENMIHIIRELLFLATLRNEDLVFERVDMESTFQKALLRVKRDMQHDAIEINARTPLPPALGHSGWIEEIWTNFLTNAVKYGSTPVRISIGHEISSDGLIKFWLQDEGDGIPEKNRPQLFTAFSRFSDRKVEGTGLGLSIVKRITDKLNGRVGVEVNPDTGKLSRFYIELPATR